MRRAGADETAFDTIAAFGEHAVEPHHDPTDRPLRRGDVVKVDFGALAAGYHSDMTRTLVVGEPAGWQREIYDLVADAQAMVDALPDASLVVVPRSGHLTAVEAPEAFNLAAREFLTSLS